MRSATRPAEDRAAPVAVPDGAVAAPRAPAPRIGRKVSAAQAAGMTAPDPTVIPERRRGGRREPNMERAFSAPTGIADAFHWFPRDWSYLILSMAASVAIAILASTNIPRPTTIAILCSAVLLAWPIGRVHRYVAHRSFAMKVAGLVATVMLPLFLFGLGMSIYARNGNTSWDVSMAVLLCVCTIATAYLRRQPASIFAAQLAIWSAAVVINASMAGVLGLLVSMGVAVLVCREQLAEQRDEIARAEARERVQTRARDILADYEETGQGWFWETDRRSLLTYVSLPVAKLVNRNTDRLIGQPLTRLFDLADTGEEGERTLQFHMSARSAFTELPVRAALNGEERWWSISGRPIYDQFDNFVGFRGSGTDLTEKRRSQEHASRLARYDSLTGLANRFEMSQNLEKILGAHVVANRNCAILLLDLDRFKHVNDTLGHPAGDALLKQVAQRLERAVGKMGQVGRLGGDEFKVIVPTKVPQSQLAALAHEIIHSLSQPYSIEGQRVVIGASVGIAVSPEHGDNSEELIRNADLALYAAKDGGRGRYHFYAQDLHAEAEARAQLEEDLRDAVTNGDLQLYYQPVVSMDTETITGFEALLRWNHPVRGWISPQRFVALAEDCGLIQQIGEWALRQACRDLANWPEQVRVAVNVSPIQFSNEQLPTIVANAIAQAQVHPSRLELEITESVFLSDDEGTDQMFAALKRIGVRLALDDFGTGYSSLGYLKKAPFDKIKIDQSFVRGATEKGSRNGAIIASITSLAQALGMDTTAEGVETHDELDLVRSLGCSHVQGYIYDRPLSCTDAGARLASGLAAVAKGPKCSRAPRQKMLRKVVLDHHGHVYNGTIRNISVSGAMVEGLWNVPVGTVFQMQISQNRRLACTTRWSEDDRMGVEFAEVLQRDKSDQLIVIHEPPPKQMVAEQLQKAG